jgi:hypothetical protein
MQIGGTLGTAVLGAVMSAKVSSLLPASWHAAHLPALTGVQLAGLKNAASVGVAPVTPGMPQQLASLVTGITHAAFMAGMHSAFLVASAVALAGAAVALVTRPGNGTADARAAL